MIEKVMEWEFLRFGVSYSVVLRVSDNFEKGLNGGVNSSENRSFEFCSSQDFSKEFVIRKVSELLNPIF